MNRPEIDRRGFLKGVTAAAAATALSPGLALTNAAAPARKTTYSGPNVIIVRFGGGARRRETIGEGPIYSPFLSHFLVPRGTLYSNMEIASVPGIETSHGQGTLYILTGKYDKYKDVGRKFLGDRFEPKVPTVFEYLREHYNVPDHQTLIVNNENRIDEEFYTFSNHHLYGISYHSNVLSLYRFKTYLLRQELAAGIPDPKVRAAKEAALRKLENLDFRAKDLTHSNPEIDRFWAEWERFYGTTGMVNPRGDSLLTELAIRALGRLRPKLMMINYTDCDYVHWGNPMFYTRGISTMDEGIQRLYEAVQADPEYRDQTVFLIVPDCGRDNNRCVSVPFQHHFGSRSSHEIFLLAVGPGIRKGQVVDKLVEQNSVARSVAEIMKFPAAYTEGPVLEEMFA